MLSDEEKKAIKYFYNLRATIDESNILFDEDINIKCGNETIKQITLVLNLIEKQQKEIEELKNITKSYDSFLGDEKIVIADKNFFVNGYFQENFVRKDKIKDIIDRIDYDIKKTKEIILKNTNIYASYRKNDYQIVRLRAMNTKSLDIKKRLQELLEGDN